MTCPRPSRSPVMTTTRRALTTLSLTTLSLASALLSISGAAHAADAPPLVGDPAAHITDNTDRQAIEMGGSALMDGTAKVLTVLGGHSV